ncbi:S8 family serine peptidase [Actinocorallia sp. API 0066]|uniref:S8 family peptidase n=1 Tax=Actinocorallia sp. API 0066 TaxID=2896846 RepID=UPI001E2C64A0|nr:S8 family serine peptidase [Actinocorallia sp. API 0066]MCD0451872.1 S8 family serine peptidase [Actinocorallia sp. API 0066]
MFDQGARVERLLARHRDVQVVQTGALLRRDEVLVAEPDLARAEDLLRRWTAGRERGPGLTRLRLNRTARVDVCELSLLARERGINVSPNHLVYGQPMWWTGPADRPRPADPFPVPEPGPSRRDVTVAVLDTGLDPHPWYSGADWFAEHEEEHREVPDADLDYELDAQAGHGTFVAGVVLQRAPTARIVARRVIGGDGVGDELQVINALHGLKADVVNLSLGCHTFDDRPSPLLQQAIAALGRATVVVACAGNTACDRPFWPAALKQVVAVAALDGADRAWFSNHGWWVDAAAQGTAVRSSFVRFGEFAGYATWSGTSFAAPVVAGMVAARVAEGLAPAEAADAVLASGPVRPGLGTLVEAG